MPFTLTMPKLSPTMEEGSIAKWHKQVGQEVQPGQVLFEVATDKATVEYEALDAGFLRQILVSEGKDAKVGQAVAVFSASKDEDISSYKPEGIAPQEEKKVVSQEERKEESQVKEEKAGPAKAAFEQPLFTPEPPLAHYVYPFAEEAPEDRMKASPYARKLAKERGVDLSTVKGSGPGNRVLSRDLPLAQPQGDFSFGQEKLPDVAPGSYEEVPLSPMRKVIATRLQQSKSFIPHFYVTQAVDAEPMLTLREQLKAGGVKVTVNDILVRASALALRKHPRLNSGFNSATQSLIFFKTVDISIAVSVEAGLITPIVRYADHKNLGQIAVEVRALAEKAKTGKLAREEYIGGSFTLSNLGMYGISEFKGIINPPQSSLLAVAGIEEKAVVKAGSVVPGKVLTLSLSCDHRVVDGADAAQFMKTLQRLLENPALLLV